MEELWIDLYERDYIELGDVTVLQSWLSALEEVGYKFPKPPPPSRRRIKDVVLMGQFNFPNLADVDSHNQTERNNEEQVKQDLLFWYQKWRQRFDTVVLRGPFPEQLAKEFRVSHQIDVRPTRQRLQRDRGFVSPMDNLLSTLKQYKDDPGIKGVLYVHDDMLVNTTNIFFGDDNKDSGADRTKTIYATSNTNGPRTSFRIHPSSPSVASNGETSLLTELYYSTTDGFLSSNSKELLNHLDKWGSNRRCIPQYSQVARDPRSRLFLEEDGGDPFLLVPNCQQSDFFYVPTSLTNQYETIAQLLIDHDVFLECGFPKITDFLLGKQHSSQSQQGNQLRSKQWEVGASTNLSNDVVLKSVDLCTSWESKKIRGKPKMISGCTSDKLHEGKPLEVPYSVIHPFKLTTIGYRDWSRYFDWATTGTSMFDFDK